MLSKITQWGFEPSVRALHYVSYCLSIVPYTVLVIKYSAISIRYFNWSVIQSSRGKAIKGQCVLICHFVLSLVLCLFGLCQSPVLENCFDQNS